MAQMCLFCTGIDITSLNPDPWSTIDTPQISSISSCSRHLHRLFPLYDCYTHFSSLTTPDLLLHSPHHWRLLYVYPAIYPALADNHSRMDRIRRTRSCTQQRNQSQHLHPPNPPPSPRPCPFRGKYLHGPRSLDPIYRRGELSSY